jgi:hypothetical protein
MLSLSARYTKKSNSKNIQPKTIAAFSVGENAEIGTGDFLCFRNL